MSIVLQINSDLESKLRKKATTKGMELNQYISQFLENTFSNESPANSTVSEKEAMLLQKINLDISPEMWELYLKLKEKRQKNKISSRENTQLVAITNEIEMANARRITVLAELSKIRNIPIRVLMEQLGLVTDYE
jgi:DNA repair photolyase